MDREEMLDLLKQVEVPDSATAFGPEWFDDNGVSSWVEADPVNIIDAYHWRGLFANEDALTNAIRFGACRFIGDCMCAWECIPDDVPEEVRELHAMCNEPGDAADIPWMFFLRALPTLLYHVPEGLADAVTYVLENAEGYYDVTAEVFCTDDEASIRIGVGWSDFWTIDHHFNVADSPDRAEFVRRLNEGLPYYMQVEL